MQTLCWLNVHASGVLQVRKVEWSSEDMCEFSFTFLFDKFKQFYLLRIFPHFDASLSIYKPSLGQAAVH